MEGRGHVQLGAQQPHELAPKHRREDGVTVQHHRLRHPVQADDVGEECLGDRLGRVRVRQRNEVAVFAETIHHREDDGFATNAGQSLDEI